MNIKRRKNITFMSLGSELIKVETSLFIEGMEFMLLRGLRIFRFLRDLKFIEDCTGRIKVKISTTLIN